MAADGSSAGEGRARIIEASTFSDYVLDTLREWRRLGHKTALLTLVKIDGSSPRPLGSQMAVNDAGQAVGAITGGCAEQSLILDALDAIARGQNRVELYGQGSRFKDIVLPCGSGIHVGFDVCLTDDELEGLQSARQQRRGAAYVFAGDEVRFEHVYRPRPRLIVLGSGHIVPLLAQFASIDQTEVIIYSPEETTRQRCAAFGLCYTLNTPADWTADDLDRDTAVVSLFHDHAFEVPLLDAALRSAAGYVGALGSQRAHANRTKALSALGWTADELSRLHGPVGLHIGAKTPSEIAISIMAEVIQARRLTTSSQAPVDAKSVA